MSKIEWTDETWNPVVGCTKCSLGCDNCYAERMANRLAGMGKEPYHLTVTKMPKRADKLVPLDSDNCKWVSEWTGDVICRDDQLAKPLHGRKPRMIFVCSMGDLFLAPFEFIDKVVEVAEVTPWHTYQLLTKRPKQMLEYFKWRWNNADQHTLDCTKAKQWKKEHNVENNSLFVPNLWLGVTVCNQKEADEKIPILLQIPAAVRFISIEPMLGAVDIRKYISLRQKCVDGLRKKGCGFTGSSDEFNHPEKEGAYRCPKCKSNHDYLITPSINQAIVGGESGPGARPLHPNWARSVRDQCKAAGVPFFFKQWGEWIDHALTDIKPTHKNAKIVFLDGTAIPWDVPDGRYYERYVERGGRTVIRVGKKKAGHLLDGKEIRAYPK